MGIDREKVADGLQPSGVDQSRAGRSGPSEDDLRWLACPVCYESLRLVDGVVGCSGCRRSYPIVDGLPILLADRALPPR